MTRHIDRLAKLQESLTPTNIKPIEPSKRVLQRLETEALGINATISRSVHVIDGVLINISAAGCCVRLAGDVPLGMDIGAVTTIAFPNLDKPLARDGYILAIDNSDGEGCQMRFRFRSVAPEKHHDLLTWISELTQHDFHTRFASRPEAE